MTPAAIIAAARREGLAISLEAGNLWVSGERTVVDRWRPVLRAEKPAIALLLKSEEWTDSAPDLDPGWRRRVILDTWHCEWSAVRQSAGDVLSPHHAREFISSLVATWNAVTGDRHTKADYLAELSSADFVDTELMTRGALALYAWTLWHRDATPIGE